MSNQGQEIKRIMLIDNSRLDISIARRALEQIHFKGEVVVCNDGMESLQYLFDIEKHALIKGKLVGKDLLPNLILLDLDMPNVAGTEVLKKIKANSFLSFIPVFIFTSSRNDRDIIRSYQHGASGYIQKPLQFALMKEKLDILLKYQSMVTTPLPFNDIRRL